MQIKNICCIGAGYVGGPSMAVLALKCPEIKVTVVDINAERIAAWNGSLENLPVYEPGLAEVINEVRGKNLFFSSEVDKAINESEMIFMAVNTPTRTEGEGAGMAADLRHVEECAKNIAKVSITDKIIIEKSTLPVRTAEKIKEILDTEGNGVHFEILSNPEFLAEGTAIQDLFKSDRILVGGDETESGQKAVKTLVDIYAKWIPREKILTTNVWSSELAKLASNAMLAQRISSINSLSALCEKTGADIDELSKAIGMDHRIGPKFLKASVGFGGSCFKKDILNLVYISRHYSLDEIAEFWLQVLKINDYQKKRFTNKIIEGFGGNVKGKKIAILGWAFKAETNDSRDSPSISITNQLLKAGAQISIYDPMVPESRIYSDLKEMWDLNYLDFKQQKSLSNNLKVFKKPKNALKDVQSVVIQTGWDEFKNYNWKDISNSLENNGFIYDGSRLLKGIDIENIYFIGT
jgi:UDPglucose 6-dehydrogenase